MVEVLDVLRNASNQPDGTNYVQLFYTLKIRIEMIKFIFTNMHVYICGREKIKEFFLQVRSVNIIVYSEGKFTLGITAYQC